MIPTRPSYPLKFTPDYQYRVWGGRRLATLFGAGLPGEGPIGESWLLSDRSDHCSIIANGALQGWTLRQLLHRWPDELLGRRLQHPTRFPLLLKFLDVQGALSVQVHPSGEGGKTEAWVVLGTGPKSRIYAGLRPDSTPGSVQQAVADGRVVDILESFVPQTRDAVFVPAGLVHSLRDVVVFEVQENSDVTFRLYDWNQVDALTHEPRPLQVKEALSCIDFSQGASLPVVARVEEQTPVLRERLFDCAQFTLWRLQSLGAFTVGKAGTPRVLVCIAGAGSVRHEGLDYGFGIGEVVLLPAIVGACTCRPEDRMTLLEIALPQEISAP